MKVRYLAVLLPLLLGAGPLEQSVKPLMPSQQEKLLVQAQAASQNLLTTLQSTLKAALAAGDPAQAIQVCQLAAPEIASGIARAEGIGIRRVSLRQRNPANRPDAFERATLQSWARGEAAPLHQLERYGSQRIFRYMQPIKMQQACLQCHGPVQGIRPEVRQLLQRFYPLDQATGYREGELRGAVSVSILAGP
ncbi:MAG: hypothetical protein CVV27_12665 [Candidatus Melainabacteria bacterium HGW-Melainabacteria-1]|nr:MAG: hypothetical protein CVV27_12665 [Candidatus Melainabacteria bacterium HGW-Melainabacteria-1]